MRETGVEEVSGGRGSRGLKTLTDPDVALKTAIKAAVAAGRYDRAIKLLEVLRATPPVAAVVDLAPLR